MNKGDLIEKIAAAHGISKTAAGGAIDTIYRRRNQYAEEGQPGYAGRIRHLLRWAAKGS